jgi:hypothetical protein
MMLKIGQFYYLHSENFKWGRNSIVFFLDPQSQFLKASK